MNPPSTSFIRSLLRRTGICAFAASFLTTLIIREPVFADDLVIEAVTFNIRFANPDDGPNAWEHRSSIASDLIRRLDPDILGVQEALASQIRDLEAALPHLSREGVGRDDGLEAGEFSPIFYRNDRFQRIEGGTFWLSGTPEEAGSNTWGAACVRICTWLLLEDKATQRRFAVYNAHFDHQAAAARARSARLIAQTIVKRGHHEIPYLILGDLNATPDDAPLRFLIGDGAIIEPDGPLETSPLPLRNTLQGPDAGQRRTFNGWRGGTTGEQIDYILAPPFARVLGSAIIRSNTGGRFPSDHYPVSATLAFSP
ncbi:MAG TPA: endonuclease/exonuclease/phosphatase family protein [Verrucomicrobiales bacterium]|nr:endonuclease/exonuclease/phosphatase family protein [Verrucomicrobiales bacterium]